MSSRRLSRFYDEVRHDAPKDMCHEWSHELAERVPGLTHVAGRVDAVQFGRRGWYRHHWCVRDNGRVVDPSAKQFDRIYGYRMEWVCPDHPDDEYRADDE